MSRLTLGSAVRGFFDDYIKCQKGLRMNTVRSYRDTLRLFLLFVVDDTGGLVSRVKLADLTADVVRRFLNHLEANRQNHIRSRNQRLSALRVFFEYLARQDPELLCEAERVAAIPTKRVPLPETFFLERDEVQTILTICQALVGSPYGIAVYCCFSIKPGPEYRRLRISKFAILFLKRHRVYIFTARVISGAFVLCGKKQPHFCSSF